MDPAIKAIDPERAIAGPAFTVRCGPHDNLAVHRAVAEAPRGSILVVDAHAEPAGFWGEILATAAWSRGIAGLVIDGGVRDTARLRTMDVGVWARHVCIDGVDKQTPGELQLAIVCGGRMVEPGMIVVADGDGIVTIPADDVPAIVIKAREREAREAILLERIREGESTLDLLNLRPFVPADHP